MEQQIAFRPISFSCIELEIENRRKKHDEQFKNSLRENVSG